MTINRHRLAADAVPLLPITSINHLGLGELADRHVDIGEAQGRTDGGDKLLTWWRRPWPVVCLRRTLTTPIAITPFPTRCRRPDPAGLCQEPCRSRRRP